MPSTKAQGSKPTHRIIKKYPNRRLYDTNSSSYITLTDVKQLVMNGEAFAVKDAKTSDDLTRAILLQIILEEEAGGEPMFTEAMLANIIRFYGNAMQGFMGSYLEKNIQAMIDVQNKVAENAQPLTPELWTQYMTMQSPLLQGMMGAYAEQSQDMFAKVQEQMQKQTEQMLGVFGVARSGSGS